MSYIRFLPRHFIFFNAMVSFFYYTFQFIWLLLIVDILVLYVDFESGNLTKLLLVLIMYLDIILNFLYIISSTNREIFFLSDPYTFKKVLFTCPHCLGPIVQLKRTDNECPYLRPDVKGMLATFQFRSFPPTNGLYGVKEILFQFQFANSFIMNGC